MAETKSKSKWLIENVVSLGLALFLVLMIRSSVIEAYKIPSASMKPTLLVGDHIFVNKFAYGWKIPFTDCISRSKFIGGESAPERGDIIVFIYPGDKHEITMKDRMICPVFGDPRTNYIKRVIGLPGDTVEVRNKNVYVNGKQINSEPVMPQEAAEIFEELREPRYNADNYELRFEQQGEHRYTRMTDKERYFTESYSASTVPPNSFFVMGDNRDHSNDSRFWGVVPEHLIKGKAVIIWLSLWLNDTPEEPTAFRPLRSFNLLN